MARVGSVVTVQPCKVVVSWSRSRASTPQLRLVWFRESEWLPNWWQLWELGFGIGAKSCFKAIFFTSSQGKNTFTQKETSQLANTTTILLLFCNLLLLLLPLLLLRWCIRVQKIRQNEWISLTQLLLKTLPSADWYYFLLALNKIYFPKIKYR